MKSSWIPVAACVVAGALWGFSCSSTPGESGDGGTTTDSGTTTTDSGTGGRDAGNGTNDSGSPGDAGNRDAGNTSGHAIQTVFVILMENTNWDDLKGSSNVPFINSLLDAGAHAEQYYDPGVHPSEPNYLWLEAGDNFGITADGTPATDSQSTTQHLVSYLEDAGISWTSWQEDIDPDGGCPVQGVNEYAPKHNPMVFFDDVNTNSARCVAHVRPYSELQAHLVNGTVPRYNFITPNLCNDMHGDTSCSNNCGQFGITPSGDQTCDRAGDAWLATAVPKILASQAFKNGGALFITWDESEYSFTCTNQECPIGMIVLSPYAKVGYSNSIPYDHSSTLRTMQEIFGVPPFLRAAADAGDLSDLFTRFP